MVVKRIFSVLTVFVFLGSSVFADELKSFVVEKNHPLKGKVPDVPNIEYCGYKNKKGKTVIEAKYQTCSSFKKGSATVEIYGQDYFPDDGWYSLYCISPTGEIIHTGACHGYSGISEKGEAMLMKMLSPED